MLWFLVRDSQERRREIFLPAITEPFRSEKTFRIVESDLGPVPRVSSSEH